MDLKTNFLQKINNNTEIVGVIGLGYVGLPLAVNFAEVGVKVIGFDKSQAKVDKINHGDNYIKDIRDALPFVLQPIFRGLPNATRCSFVSPRHLMFSGNPI